MKPFTLESVLSYRVQLEKIAKNRLFEAEKKRSEILLRIKEKENFLKNLITDLAKRQSEGMDVVEMIRYEEKIELEKNVLTKLNKTLVERNAEVIKERENLLNKSKERKVMEKLKEKQNAAWRQYLNKKEAAMLDEIAVIFHER
jgi:flagellar FliJ protein